MESKKISSEFPYESKYVDILGSKIHYVDEGEAETILFIHGNPTSNYLWRNIIPYMSDKARCIAPDLIGMGKSDKPDINYGFEDSFKYLEAFINKMELKNVTLVLHDWGSGLGFHYANLNRANVKAIAFMESIHDVPSFTDLPISKRMAFSLIRHPIAGKFLVRNFNLFIKKMLPDFIVRDLSDAEKAAYAEPYQTKESRRPLWVWSQEVPFDSDEKTPVRIAFESWRDWLVSSEIPKLCLYATPGSAIMEEDVDKIRRTFSNTEILNVGKGLHFIQEDCPHEIGEALSEWYLRIS
ncbi:MAG: haloalkane dehalogenase [Rivularia sp. (in: cyanobacteria)]|mgnify:CR=1 FL=1